MIGVMKGEKMLMMKSKQRNRELNKKVGDPKTAKLL